MNIIQSKTEQKLGPTKALTNFVSSLSFDDFDEVTLKEAKVHLLDTIGACLAGARQPESEMTATAMFNVMAEGSIPVPGRTQKTDILTAALLTGTAAHGLELDDGFRPAGAHPGVVVVPTILAAGYKDGVDGKAFLKALIAGYEVLGRIGAVMHPRQRDRGYHTTGITGVFSAAAALGVLRSFSAEKLEHAFGIAASTASGINSHHLGGDVKRAHPGFAARGGMTAALMAEQGYLGARDILEGRVGFYNAFAGNEDGKADYANADILTAGGQINSPFVIADCYIKPHACCRHHHPILDCVIDIMQSEALKAEDVKIVDVRTIRVAAVLADVGWEDMTPAQMSVPYTTAIALRHRSVMLKHFAKDYREDKTINDEIAKIKITVDPELDKLYPEARPSEVNIITTDGRTFNRRVLEPLGSVKNQLSSEALMAKYMSLAKPIVGKIRAEEIADQVANLETLDDVRPFIDLMAL
jgi:2-methylcitrate dehydratase PrpD